MAADMRWVSGQAGPLHSGDSAVPPITQDTSPAPITSDRSVAQPGHQLFWSSCLVLVPLALISALLPYAELKVGGSTGLVYILREYPGQALAAIAASAATIGYAVVVLRKPRRTLAWVATVTCVVALFSF